MNALVRAYRETRKRLRPVRAAWRDAQGSALRLRTAYAWLTPRPAPRAHGLPRPLIVSLTSYPPRFATLAPTLHCLLMQDMRADRVVLWVAHADLPLLPGEVRALQSAGLQIETCDDTGSYKKLVPALERWPEAFIATADDDVFYPRTWLRELVAGYDASTRTIPCHRAHEIVLDQNAKPAPYARWAFEAKTRTASALTFPTGVGGVLYPPGALHPDVTRAALFTELAPTSDDAWFYMMARRQGWRFHRISARRFVSWPRSQAAALQHANVAGANDAQIARLVATFGFPPTATDDAPIPEEAHAW